MKSIVTLTLNDLIEAKKLSIRPRKAYLITLFLLLVPTLSFLIFGIFHSITQESSDYTWIWLLGFILYFSFLYYSIVYVSAKRQFKQNKKLSEPIEIEITEDSFRTKASYGNSELKFTDFHKWKFNKKIILMYHSDALFQVIPSRIFSNEEERLAVISSIQEHCGKAVK